VFGSSARSTGTSLFPIPEALSLEMLKFESSLATALRVGTALFFDLEEDPLSAAQR
jgi:hypothetical protein